jgi:hypothetical protein
MSESRIRVLCNECGQPPYQCRCESRKEINRLQADNTALRAELAATKASLAETFGYRLKAGIERDEARAELAAAQAKVDRGVKFREWVSGFYKETRIDLDFADWLAEQELAQHDDKPQGGCNGE